MSALHLIMVWFGLADHEQTSQAHTQPSATPAFGWGATFALLAAAFVTFFAGYGFADLASPTASEIPEKPDVADEQAQIDLILGNAFVEEQTIAFRGGSLRVFNARRLNSALVVFDDISAPPEGTRLTMAIGCGDTTLKLGQMAPRFYDDPASDRPSNSVILRGTAKCTTLRLEQISPTGEPGSHIDVPLGSPTPPRETLSAVAIEISRSSEDRTLPKRVAVASPSVLSDQK